MARLHDPGARSFASDNHAGAHPELIAALAEANGGHQPAYGGDAYTARLREVVATHFGEQAEVYPVFNGTGANVVSLQAMLPRWGAVICAESAHVNTDENGACERVAGIKLLSVATPDGKLTPDLVDRHAWGFGDVHRAQPLVVTVTESSEVGTVYSPQELASLCTHAHSLQMRVHLDGARLANAAAALDVPLRALTTDAGIDVVSLGGTKNGMLFGEAIVVLDPQATTGIDYLRKSGMQLASKMRFVSAQLVALFEDDLWLTSARHANAMARRLHDAVTSLPGVRVTRTVEANAVFAVLPEGVADRLRERYRFYDWDHSTGELRWMCAFDTTEDDVDAFAGALEKALTGG
ncbi:MAG: threonine aldolase family protein [Acidimicrobiales bacterium]